MPGEDAIDGTFQEIVWFMVSFPVAINTLFGRPGSSNAVLATV
jgi:hypothetical protein